MHASAETTLGRARLSFADTAEIDEFVRVLDLAMADAATG